MEWLINWFKHTRANVMLNVDLSDYTFDRLKEYIVDFYPRKYDLGRKRGMSVRDADPSKYHIIAVNYRVE